MNCQEFKSLRADLLYEELDTRRAAACREHLAGCANCREEFETIARLRGQLTQLPEPAVHVDLGRLLSRVLADERRTRRRSTWGAALAVAAGLVITLSLPLEWEMAGDHLLVRWKGAPAAGEVAQDASRDELRSQAPTDGSSYLRLRNQMLAGAEMATQTSPKVSSSGPLLYGDWRRNLQLLEDVL